MSYHAAAQDFCVPSSVGDELVACMPEMRRIAQQLCRHRENAEDAVQTAFLRAWAARDRFRSGDVKAWFFVILRNCIASRGRREKWIAPWTDDLLDRLPGHEHEQSSALELSETIRAIATLPEEQRLALLAVGPGGRSYEDVAAASRCARGTIKSRVSRARGHLRRVLDADPSPVQGHRRGRRPQARLRTGDLQRMADEILHALQSETAEAAR